MADPMLEKLNSYNSHVQFTMEVQKEDNSIDFLDTTVINEGETLKTKWFHKPIASNRLLNYYSKHPRNMILNTAKSFIKRVFTLSHASFHRDNNDTIKRILLKNNFPPKTVEKLIHQARQTMYEKRTGGNSSYPFISQTSSREQTTTANLTNGSEGTPLANSTLADFTITPTSLPPKKKLFAGMTYVPGLTEVVSKRIQKYVPELTIAPRAPNKVGNIFTNMKQKLRIGQCSCVVYSIPCGNCPRKYVGCTGNRLDDRTSQHKNDLKNMHKNNHKTALVFHAHKHKHAFDFAGKTILRKVRKKRTLKIHEANHIILEGNSTVNFRKDAEHVSPVFYNLIKNNRKKPRNANPSRGHQMNLDQLFRESDR